MRIPVVLLLTCGLTACAPRVPDSGAGVGFTDYNSYLREREANPGPAAALPPVAFSTDIAASAIADSIEASRT